MDRSTFVLFTLIGVLAAGAAGAGNLVTNPGFDSNANGWLLVDDSQMRFSHRPDLGSSLPGGSGPGSMEVRLTYSAGGWSGTYQADIPILGGRDYEFGASVLIPGSENSTLGPSLMLEVFDASHSLLVNRQVSQTGAATDTWLRMTTSLTVPTGAATARLWLGVLPSQNQGETRPAFAYYDDALLSADAAAPVTQSLFVPAAAAAHGVAPTYWSTNGWFSNLTGATVNISGAFLRQGQDNGAAVASPSTLGTIPPYGFTKLDDIVTLLGVSEKTGGLYLELSASGGDLPLDLAKVTTHTFTPNPSGDGVYGQGIPAVAPGILKKTCVPGVFQSADMRTNIGALNTSGDTITLDITILNAAGNEVASPTWTLLPYEQRQVLLPSLGLTSLDGGTVIFELSGHGSYRAYTSTVDQESGDAVYNEAR